MEDDTNIKTGHIGNDPEITKTFAFGKIDYEGKGRAANAVEVEINLRVHRQTRRTVDLKPITGYLSFSATGSIWNARHTDTDSGGQNLEEIASHYGALPFNRDKFKRIVAIWREYHLNDMTPGTREQTACVAAAKAAAIEEMKAAGYTVDRHGYGFLKNENGVRDYGTGRYYYPGHDWYGWACGVLKAAGLYAVPTGEMSGFSPKWYGEMSIPRPVMYTFGSAHLVNPLPADVFTEIVDLFCDSEPARDRFNAWLKDNGVRLEPFGDALMPVVEVAA